MYLSTVKRKKNDLRVVRSLAALLLLISVGCAGNNPSVFSTVESGEEKSLIEQYQLQEGDQLSIQVYREPQLSGEFWIDSAGFIHHPLCGPLKTAGLTVGQMKAGLERLLSDNYLVNPSVIVSLISAKSSSIIILGEVKTPGVHPIPFGGHITLLQVIATAGGFTDLASLNRVTVTRTVNGKEESIRVKVSRIIAGQEPDLLLKPNDVVVVPEVVF